MPSCIIDVASFSLIDTNMRAARARMNRPEEMTQDHECGEIGGKPHLTTERTPSKLIPDHLIDRILR
jgi:hypothetical protein